MQPSCAAHRWFKSARTSKHVSTFLTCTDRHMWANIDSPQSVKLELLAVLAASRKWLAFLRRPFGCNSNEGSGWQTAGFITWIPRPMRLRSLGRLNTCTYLGVGFADPFTVRIDRPIEVKAEHAAAYSATASITEPRRR